jgi:GTP-binding protein
MNFSINDSPFAGREGQFTTSRQIQERLYRELETDMALRVEANSDGTWTVSGRGELHLAILIERMRRESYEFQVSRPEVITHTVDGKVHTPYERVVAEVPEPIYGSVLSMLGARQGELMDMRIERGVAFLEFVAPTRALLGFRSQFTIETKGEGILTTAFLEYRPDPGKWREEKHGSLVAHETGKTVLYGLVRAQDRGTLFFHPGVPVYKGQVVGENSRGEDISVNVCKEKVLTNMRSKGEGVMDHFNEPRVMGLEAALEYISEDELVEVCPSSIRIRKRILDQQEYRKRVIHGIVSG